MPLWKHGRAAVLEGLMGTYRDGIELTFVKALKGEVLGSADDVQSAGHGAGTSAAKRSLGILGDEVGHEILSRGWTRRPDLDETARFVRRGYWTQSWLGRPTMCWSTF